MACQGDVCRVSRGSHGFSRPGPYPLQRRSLSLVGEDGCWVHGRWYCEESTGNATGLNFYADPARDSEEDMRLRGRVVQVVAGSWVLTSCSIQCVDGIPLATLERSSIEADACVFGGTEASVYMSSCGHDDINSLLYGGILMPANEQEVCLLYTSPSPRDKRQSRMPSSA